jgi:hypothetical protein
MGRVESAVRESVYEGMVLATPAQAKPFEVAEITRDGIVLLLGQGRWRTPIPWDALEGLADLLRGQGWVRTSGAYERAEDTTSPSGYLKQFVDRETSNWVMVVMERAGVVELDRRRPVRARLTGGF